VIYSQSEEMRKEYFTFLLSVTIVTRIYGIENKESQRKVKDDDIFKHNNCLVNVHGFHHSGTGLFRSLIYKAIGGSALVSAQKDTDVSEDEGQHLQNVYPTFAERTHDRSLCTDDNISWKRRGPLYYCPKLLQTTVNDKNKAALFEEWSKYWDLNKPFLLQKTPMLDVLLLERLKVTPMFHAIVMRHPLNWHSGEKGGHYISFTPYLLLVTWLETWSNTLEQLSNGNIDDFVVVNFEMLLLSPDIVTKKIRDLVTVTCFSQIRRLRKLYYYGQEAWYAEKNDSSLMQLDEIEEDRWHECQNSVDCKELMSKMTPIISQLGYTWDKKKYYSRRDRDILFSPKTRPSAELVQSMKKLANEETEKLDQQ